MNLWFDLKYAWRLLTKSWGYSLMCASVVALSIGLSVWTYSLAYSQIFKPLGFPGSERWYAVEIAAKSASDAKPSVDAYTYQQILGSNRSADHLGAFAGRTAVLSEGQASRSLRAAAITPRLLSATQVAPFLGRVFQETDGRPDAAAVAVLSYDTWQTYFAGDKSIVGKTARIDSAPVQIVGVMPKEFFAFQDFELWVPLQTPKLAQPQDSTRSLSPIIVLGANQNLPALLSEMKSVVTRVNGDYPDLFNAKRRVELIPAHRMYTHSSAPIMVMLGFMCGAVLLLGCVNISMVFMARLLERSRELALRSALGSSRGRLIRNCLLETALVVALGLVVGYGLAAVGVRWTRGISDFISQVEATGRDANLLTLRPVDFLAAVGVAMVVWLLSTLIPAWRVARQDAAVVLAGTGKGASMRSSNKSVGLLVGLQVIISCLVLVVCANVVLAVNKEVNKPTGVDSSGVMVTTYPTVFDARYDDPAQRVRYWDDLTAAVESKIPGATVAFATAAPTIPSKIAAAIESQEGTAKEGVLRLPHAVVSDGYFKLTGLGLRSGRLFDSTDTATSLNVAVVDEKLVSRYWPNGDALGKRIQLNPATNGPWVTIVGIVSAVAGRPYHADENGVLYQPLRQVVPAQFHFLARLPNAGTGNTVALRAAAFGVDRDLPLQNLQLLSDHLAAVNVESTALVPVVIVVSLITALLAASGLFGLISRSVAQRTQEMGIRRALGATPWRATARFRRQGAVYLTVAVIGVALGVMIMTALSTQIENIFDYVVPATLGVILLTALVMFSASYLPSRRAVSLEPGEALRYE